MQLRKIDGTGLFAEDVIANDIPLDAGGNPDTAHYIATPCPAGFYWPKWDGTQWVEGGTAPEPVVQPPTEDERIAWLESAMSAMMGV